MDTKFKLIKTAQDKNDHSKMVAENFDKVARAVNEDGKALMEGATHVLAGLKALMSAGKPLAELGLSPASLAGLVAGIEVLAKHLPKMDPVKKPRALKVLGDLALGAKMSLGAVQAIANLAEKNPRWEQLQQAFNTYAETGAPNPELASALSKLQAEVDQAIRAGAIDQPTAVRSGGASPLGQPA